MSSRLWTDVHAADERCSALIEIVSKRSEQMSCENIAPRCHKKINGKLQ